MIYLAWPSLKIWAQLDLVWFFFGGGLPPILPKISFWLGGGRGVKFFITNFYHLFVLANPENLSSTGLCLIFGGYLGCLPPFPPKIRAGGKFFITNLDHLFCLALVKFLANLGGPPIFAQKSGLGLGGVFFFITNFDLLFGHAFPENLSSIGLNWFLGWFCGF